ncbi:MAG: hypothetical protein LBL24_04640 [Bacteroidales bacterium]|nr:hypothetical protein [Bacteroidales bacterium]
MREETSKALEGLGKPDFSEYPYDEAKKLMSRLGKFGYILVALYQEGKIIMRARPDFKVSPKCHKSRGNFSVAALAVLIFALYACSSTQPMTKKVDSQASTVGKINDFQYYVSRNIILTKTEDPEIIGKVAVSGQLKVTSTREIIQITSSTMGALLKTETDAAGNKVYFVAFETDNDNCLRFVQRENGNDERIYFLYDDDASSAINYGDAVYIVEWKGISGLKQSKLRAKSDNSLGKLKGKFKGVTSDDKDNPYLLVKMKTKFKEKENYRKASGRKVEVK